MKLERQISTHTEPVYDSNLTLNQLFVHCNRLIPQSKRSRKTLRLSSIITQNNIIVFTLQKHAKARNCRLTLPVIGTPTCYVHDRIPARSRVSHCVQRWRSHLMIPGRRRRRPVRMIQNYAKASARIQRHHVCSTS